VCCGFDLAEKAAVHMPKTGSIWRCRTGEAKCLCNRKISVQWYWEKRFCFVGKIGVPRRWIE
jgi:hypothetical protein